MTTSGSTNFTQSKNELILDAFRLINAYGIGRTVSPDDMQFASNLLNKMVKSWATQGLHLWSKEEAVLYVTPGTPKYLIASTAKVSLASDEILTQLNGNHTSSTTSLTVDSTTNMAVGDSIGIVLSDKTFHWTTIATIPTSTSLTITSGLSGDANDDGLVVTYTTTIAKPYRVLDARKRTGVSGENVFDLPLTEIPYQDYMSLPVKNSQSSPTQFYYNPNLSTGTMYLWPCPSDGNERIHFTFERIIEDLDNTSDNFDFPGEWLEPLTYGLALRLARPFGKAAALRDLVPMATGMLRQLMDWDSEISHVDFVPDLGYDS